MYTIISIYNTYTIHIYNNKYLQYAIVILGN